MHWLQTCEYGWVNDKWIVRWWIICLPWCSINQSCKTFKIMQCWTDTWTHEGKNNTVQLIMFYIPHGSVVSSGSVSNWGEPIQRDDKCCVTSLQQGTRQSAVICNLSLQVCVPPECNCNTIRALKLCPEIVGESWRWGVTGWGSKKDRDRNRGRNKSSGVIVWCV